MPPAASGNRAEPRMDFNWPNVFENPYLSD